MCATFFLLSFFCLSFAPFLLLIRPLTVALSSLLPDLIHSFRSPPYERPTASSNTVLYTGRSSASFFIFHYPVVSLRLYNSCLRLLTRPPLSSNPSMCLPFNNMFQKAVSTEDVTNPVSLPPEYYTRVGTLIVATIYLQLIQNKYMFRSLTVLQCSHQHCVQPVASDVEVVGYL